MRKIKNFICVMLVMFLCVNMITVMNPTEVKADNEVVWTVMDVNSGNALGASLRQSIMNSGGGKATLENVNLSATDLAKPIPKSMTWYTADSLYSMNVVSNGKTFTLSSISYAGPESNLNLVLPDKVRFVTCTNVKKDKTTAECTFDSVELYLTSIGTSFSGKSYDNFSTNAFLNLTLGQYVTTLDANAFAGNTKLKSVIFKGVIQSMGQGVFKECINLTSLDLDNLYSAMIDIPNQCFYKCNSLANVSIPKGIQNIGSQAFYQCDQIDFILLKDTIKTVGREAFAMCTNMRYVYITSTYQSNWDSIVDASEKDKLITHKANSPIVAVKGSSSSVGSNVFNNCILTVVSDVDIVDCSVTLNGSDIQVTQYTDTTKKYRTLAYSFDVSQKGTYHIEAGDTLGNTITKTVKYSKKVNDNVAPNIVVGGKTNSKTVYLRKNGSIKITDTQTFISSVVTNGKTKTLGDKYKTYTIALKKEGKYKYTAVDAMGNKRTCTVYFDKTAPKITDLSNNPNNKILVITDNVTGVKSIKLDGKKMNPKYFTDKGYNINQKGKHSVVVMDKAGNMRTYSFTL